jgi:hypothetical protein
MEVRSVKKCTDKDLLKKSSKIVGKKGQKVEAYGDFRRQFDKYRRAKGSGEVAGRSVCRPYVEIFQKGDHGGKS